MSSISFNSSVAKKFLNLQKSAKRRGVPFELSIQSIINMKRSKKCFYTGKALNSSNLSIDRIDNTKGYVIGNVVACDREFNLKKGHLSLQEIRQMQKALR